jgi:large conductance mechanosensitive channel
MKILREFREFISRGSVMDLAVGVIIGAAFGKIVTSLVDQVIMPVVGVAMSGVDFADLKIILRPADAVAKRPEAAILYGAFINTIIQFLIVGVVVFLIVKMVNTLRRLTAKEDEAAASVASPPHTEVLLTEIRDLLKAQAKPASAAAHQKGSTPSKRA